MYESDDPIALTIPSPTLAIIVSSVAPPTRPGILVRTVTRARALTSIPSLATAANVPEAGASITFGYTDVSTAVFISRPARSIAVEVSKSSGMFALFAAIIEKETFATLPPAR